MTIPSVLTMLVHVFPEEVEQARAFTIFGGFAAMGNGTPLHTVGRALLISFKFSV
jgi:hypothetical protein